MDESELGPDRLKTRNELKAWIGKSVKLTKEAVRMYNSRHFIGHFKKTGHSPFETVAHEWLVGTVVGLGDTPDAVLVDWGHGPEGLHFSYLILQ